MSESQRFAQREEPLSRYEYEDAIVFAADLGPGIDDEAVSIDVVDGTAIVVIGGQQYEFDVPAGAANTAMRNGVLTVEVSR